jgi:hypothetical protein
MEWRVAALHVTESPNDIFLVLDSSQFLTLLVGAENILVSFIAPRIRPWTVYDNQCPNNTEQCDIHSVNKNNN